jgi:hypothetical protein
VNQDEIDKMLKWMGRNQDDRKWKNLGDVTPDEEAEFNTIMENPPEPKPVVAWTKDAALLASGRFDEGVSYVTEHCEDDASMIWVYDKFGVKDLYFRDRFRIGFDE